MLYNFSISGCVTKIANGNAKAQNMAGYLKQYLG